MTVFYTPLVAMVLSLVMGAAQQLHAVQASKARAAAASKMRAKASRSCAGQLTKKTSPRTGFKDNGRAKPETLERWPQPVEVVTKKILNYDTRRALKNEFYFWHLFGQALRYDSSNFGQVVWPDKINVQRAYYVLNNLPDLYILNPDNGNSLLNEAVRTRSLYMVKVLLKLKFDPNFASPVTGETALHILAQKTILNKTDRQIDIEMAKLLFQYGADVNIHFALKQLPVTEKLLIQRRVQYYLKWKQKSEAAQVKQLYSRRSDAQRDKDFFTMLESKIQRLRGLSPLHIAIVSKNVLATRLFLEQKADTTIQPPDQSLKQLVNSVYGRNITDPQGVSIYRLMQPYF